MYRPMMGAGATTAGAFAFTWFVSAMWVALALGMSAAGLVLLRVVMMRRSDF